MEGERTKQLDILVPSSLLLLRLGVVVGGTSEVPVRYRLFIFGIGAGLGLGTYLLLRRISASVALLWRILALRGTILTLGRTILLLWVS